ncbi:MAG: STAS domain-containing protein [Gammaproteobacteria bacterium]|nr:STAS domain-containing protein [Gammaproteobacteria bacterium]
MAEFHIRLRDDGDLQVSGDLVFSTAGPLLRQGSELLESGRGTVIDLTEVAQCDSAGLALLLEWLELGRSKGLQVRFRGIPEDILRIAGLSNVSDLLPVAAD